MDFKNLKLKGGNKKMIKMKKERGITLIALVVTIVVLLILAGVSINAIFNENGLIKKAQEAQNKMDQATENDKKELNNLNEWIENVTNEGENTKAHGRRGHPLHHFLPDQACLQHLPQDVRPEAGHQRHFRSVRLPGHCGHHPGLL